MKFERQKSAFVLVVSYLFILLFVYASVSKLLDYDKFQVQLGQSPLLSTYAGWVAPSILILEVLVAILLVLPKSRFFGLMGSYFLMVLFTVYIYLTLHYSSFVPCSCGGVLEKMTWNQHLIFNAVLVVFAALSMLFMRLNKTTYLSVFLGVIFQVIFMYGLFVFSENSLKYNNPFIRRFSDFVIKDREIDLQYNSYYYSGHTSETIYLGNFMSPLLLTAVDTGLQHRDEKRFTIERDDLPFKSIHVRTDANDFYLYDGTVPCFFRGNIISRHFSFVGKGTTYFSVGVPIDSTRLLIRSHNHLGENTLAVTDFGPPYSSTYNDDILEKQFDGNFDSDGMLHYDSQLNKGVYVYRYRNQYMLFDTGLSNVEVGKTIDTVSIAQIKTVYNSDKSEKTLAEPPLVVNHQSCVYKGLLFIQSGLIGKFEDKNMWNQASVIDVYSLENQAYVASFYVYHIDRKKVSRFFVFNNHFYAFIGTKLVRYTLTDMITSAYFQSSTTHKNLPAGSRGKIENLYNRVDH